MTIQWFKPESPVAQFIFAHGAGAGSDSDFMQTMAQHLCEHGVQVALFDFEYMQQAKALNKRRPPDRAPKLLNYFANILEQVDDGLPLFIGGKSMGGRMASMLAAHSTAPIKGVVAMGYPFHPPGKPDKLRIEHFTEIACPFLILQGERDTFGNQAEITQLQFDNAPNIIWLADGDHSLKPRKKSGFSESQHLLDAAKHAAQFIQEHSHD
ncbi:alpha/beta fold hydrolase [Pseudoalteromonas sp. JBTF-M23]|uniref:Alpha/beta fold hydrolase n=1 Tax=Pseudoalteromonas caenipelagi TaxID=2726988 RepID=A0A849VI77_9GAMM|nr:alpha/beta fold hydrolase [Pseudoalteromonas caenipelagi]NOU52520.1 alpha/beta fold hydrolase [Pseudoalteromonas caenipelagi]